MLFNSFHFMLFYPLVVLFYFALPHRVRYIWLLIASYYFYMCWNAKYAVLIGISTLITYAGGLLIGREQALWKKKLWVFLCMLSNLAILFFFKYFDFFVDNINRLFAIAGMQIVEPAFDVILPVGISFYTFQALSYTMDVYRKEIYTEKNLFRYALFVSFFPQLVAGPIERSKNLLVQIGRRQYFDYERVKSGLLLMLWGFFLKLVIADRAAILVNTVYNDYEQYEGIPLILATLFFGLQIYCDFGSYSAIAIGSAKVMGFRLMDNFRQPYFSCSIAEFWRRWHISLSTWFRDYLYVPLGGNRKGTARKYANTMIVFLVSGLWHGASWTFVIWGFLHGAFQVIGQITRPYKEKVTRKLNIKTEAGSYKLGQMFITFCLVNFAWIFFRAENFTQALGILHNISAQWNPWFLTDGSIYLLGLSQKSFWVTVFASVILLLVSAAQYNGIKIRERFAVQNLAFRWLVSLGLIFSIIVFGIYGPGYNESQFIYFQF